MQIIQLLDAVHLYTCKVVFYTVDFDSKIYQDFRTVEKIYKSNKIYNCEQFDGEKIITRLVKIEYYFFNYFSCNQILNFISFKSIFTTINQQTQ